MVETYKPHSPEETTRGSHLAPKTPKHIRSKNQNIAYTEVRPAMDAMFAQRLQLVATSMEDFTVASRTPSKVKGCFEATL
jgi:hypothetical protein